MKGLAKMVRPNTAASPRSTKPPAKLTPRVKALPAARVGFLAVDDRRQIA
ncbi:hypothetical protein [Rhodanobacter sp. A1T4]|nr:hypothetical protein [Rhodanobacter sp. A1T4]MBB6247283.1 hypothetical protein [Rhodanobacter sp. A1T4]